MRVEKLGEGLLAGVKRRIILATIRELACFVVDGKCKAVVPEMNACRAM